MWQSGCKSRRCRRARLELLSTAGSQRSQRAARRKLKSASAAEQVAEICVFGPSGVKTPEENADFMSCLKARPTKLKTFSATCEVANHKDSSRRQRRIGF